MLFSFVSPYFQSPQPKKKINSSNFAHLILNCLLTLEGGTTTRWYSKKPVLPRIMNFGRIQIPNNIRIFKNDEYEYEYYSEFEKLFEYYSWEIFE